jgi:hypothetical protein
MPEESESISEKYKSAKKNQAEVLEQYEKWEIHSMGRRTYWTQQKERSVNSMT